MLRTALSFVLLTPLLLHNGFAQGTTNQGTVATLYEFPSGSSPNSALIEASDGNLYGSTATGGSHAMGSIFKVTPSGEVYPIYSFCALSACIDGAMPMSSPIQGSDGNFYGTTENGGQIGGGTIYKLSPDGLLTTLYSFCTQQDCADGVQPVAGLIQGSDGSFYGSTIYGGDMDAYCGEADVGCGTLFLITPSKTFAQLYEFTGGEDGGAPAGTLLQADDGNYYGVSSYYGSFFRLSQGDFVPLAQWTADTGLTEGPDTRLYGTTETPQDAFVVYAATKSGTITTGATIVQGTSYFPGAVSPLFMAGDGNLYGAIEGEDLNPYGALFNTSTLGNLTTLYGFTNSATGSFPQGEIQASDGNFYGITSSSGSLPGGGTIFRYTPEVAIPSPVQLTFHSSSSNTGELVTLRWKVLNAFSKTAQQCYAFVQGGASGAGSWTGLQTGALSDAIYMGSNTITPTKAGTYTYALSCGGVESGFASLQVGGAKAVSTTQMAAVPATLLGGTTTLSAAVSSAGYFFPLSGTVTFSSEGVVLGAVALTNGSATLNVRAENVPTGIYPVAATYSGNQYYQPSSATASAVVEGYATEATVSTSQAAVPQSGTITLTAKVVRTAVSGTPTGQVTFSADGVTIGSANLINGSTSLSFSVPDDVVPGTYSLTARYTGDGNDQSAISSPAAAIVLAATNTTLAATPDPIPANQVLTLTATVKETYGSAKPSGAVTFSVDGQSIGSAAVTDGVATLNESTFGYSAGTYTVTAAYNGDGSNAGSIANSSVTLK